MRYGMYNGLIRCNRTCIFQFRKNSEITLKELDVKLEIKRRISIENETVNKYAYIQLKQY